VTVGDEGGSVVVGSGSGVGFGRGGEERWEREEIAGSGGSVGD